MKYKTKSIIKKVALALAGIVAVSAVGVGVAKLIEYMQDDLKTISICYCNSKRHKIFARFAIARRAIWQKNRIYSSYLR